MGRGGGGGAGRGGGGGSSGGSRGSGMRRGGGSSHRGGFGSSGPSRSSYSSGPRYNSGTYYGGTRHVYHHTYGIGGAVGGIFSSISTLIIVIALILIVVAGGIIKTINTDITRSTIKREPLPSGSVITTDYYSDNIGWIDSRQKLEVGMKHFFQKTGVQPYLYLTETIDGTGYPNNQQVEDFANGLYDQLFQDEGHLLLVFQEYNSNGQYLAYYITGKQAKSVVDSEAGDILLDYIDSYYYSDLKESELFSKAFEETADRMMTKTMNPLIPIVAILATVIVAFLAFNWWKKAKAQKNLEAEQTERILNTPMEDLVGSETEDSEVERLKEKYKG